jgi:hypothetical protein
MARIIVTTAERERSDARVMLNEQLRPDHLSDEQALLMERLGWTVVDAQPRSVGWRAADRRLRPPGGAVS